MQIQKMKITKLINSYGKVLYQKDCELCKKEFLCKSYKQRFCNTSCSSKYSWSKRVSKEKICPNCKKTFFSKTYSKKYCSKSCMYVAYQFNKTKNKKPCACCGEMFLPLTKWCSKSCGVSYLKAQKAHLSYKERCV